MEKTFKKVERFILPTWIILSLILGGLTTRNHIYGKSYPCECDTVGVFGSGIITLASPFWYPIYLTGEIVTFQK